MSAEPAAGRKPTRATTPLRYAPPWSLPDGPSAPERPKGRRAQPAVIRLAHWINIPLLVIMAGSGLQIFAAYPALGPRGGLYSWYPLQNDSPPSWLRFGGWLAGARHWHFAIAWFLIFNGVIYLIYMIASGEWRRRVFIPNRDTSNAIAMFGYYLRIRKTPPPEDFYNGLQRMAYTSAILFGMVVVLSGVGDLQTGPAALDHGGVRRLRRRAGRASELSRPARIVYRDAFGTRRVIRGP